MALPKLIVILGTTACGKSGLGVELAKRVAANARAVMLCPYVYIAQSPEVRARVRCYPIKGMEYERHLYLCYRKELYFARFMEDFLAIVRSKL